MSREKGDVPDDEELERELRATMASGLGSLFEDGDSVNIQTHSGATFAGTIEDSNLAGVLVRVPQVQPQPGERASRLFVVSFAGIESAEIFESDDDTDGDGEDAEGEAPEEHAAEDGGAPVTPIATRAAS